MALPRAFPVLVLAAALVAAAPARPVRAEDGGTIGSSAKPPPPVPGRSIDVRAGKGTTRLKLPGRSAYLRLVGQAQVPLGTAFDVTRGTVTLVTADGTASFTAGVFVVRESGGVTRLVLSGGDFGGCSVGNPSPTVVRRLWGIAQGRFEMTGRYAAASVRGTIWRVEDRCDGTATRVLRGTVAVTKLRNGPDLGAPSGGGGGGPPPPPPAPGAPPPVGAPPPQQTTVTVSAGDTYLVPA